MALLYDTLNVTNSAIKRIGTNSIKSCIWGWCTTYGNNVIDIRNETLRYSWTVKINKIGNGWADGIAVGLQGDSCGDHSDKYWCTTSDLGILMLLAMA